MIPAAMDKMPLFSFCLMSLSILPLFLNGVLTLCTVRSASNLLNRLEDRLDDISPILISTAEIGGVTRRTFRRVKRIVGLLLVASAGATYVFYERFEALEEGKKG